MGRTACTEPQCLYKGDLYLYKVEVKVKFTQEQATKAQRGIKGIALLFS
jgi:hypothetical protein